jgi:diadenosine tetraphosphate (Ap4A) HIT family hydrolase
MAASDPCMLCVPELADEHFTRARLWEDDLWRLSAVLQGAIAGFAHLEPKRHIPFITDLDGREAVTLGPVLARVTAALRDAAGAEKTYVYVFGDRVAHLHLNLAPHHEGDALAGGPGLLHPGASAQPTDRHVEVADAARAGLAGSAP